MQLVVFLSSTCDDLLDLRSEVYTHLEENGIRCLCSERPDFPVPRGLHAHDACLAAVEEAHFYILILDRAYGQPYEGSHEEYRGLSVTHAEYRHAKSLNRPVFAYVRDHLWAATKIQEGQHAQRAPLSNAGISPELLVFFAEIRAQSTDNYIKSFKNSAELRATILKDLWNYVLYSLQVQKRVTDVSSSLISEMGKDVLVQEKIKDISSRLETSFQETTTRLREELEARTSELRHLKGKAEEREGRIADLQAKLEELQEKLQEVETNRAVTEAALDASKELQAKKGQEVLRNLFMTAKKKTALYRTLFDLQLKSLLRENEARVVGALRTLNTGAVTYAATFPDRGFPRSLNAMGPSGAALIDSELTGGSMYGYRLEYVPKEQPQSGVIQDYEIRANPVTFVTLGLRRFYTDATAVIRYTKEARPAGPHDPPL